MKILEKKKKESTYLYTGNCERHTITVNFKVRYRISVTITLIYSFYVRTVTWSNKTCNAH